MLSETFQFKEREVLSPALFIIIIDDVTKEIKEKPEKYTWNPTI